MPKYKKLQNAAAGFVLNKYANISDVINKKWLLVEEPIEYSLAMLGFEAIYDENAPNHLKLTQKVASTRNLRSNNKEIIKNKVKTTFWIKH